ncbi:distal tail protein [Bacillus phage vB_BcgM]|nr:distal tail protein [Bacillus phage vB_BcgM]
MITKRQVENKILRLQIKMIDDLEEDGNIRAEHFGRSCITIGHPVKMVQVETVYNTETNDFDFIVTVMKDTKKEIITTLAGEKMVYQTTDVIRTFIELYNIDTKYTGYLKGV